MSILFQIAYRSFLPSVVKKEELVEANSKLEFATSGAGSFGPAIGGFLVQLLTAPFALFFGSGLYVLSGLLFRRIKVNERDPAGDDADSSAMEGIKEGLRFFWRNRVLVGIGGASATLILFSSAFEAVSLLYMVRVLGLTAGTIGLMIAASSVGLFIGAWLSSRYGSKIGIGKMATIGLAVVGMGDLALPLADGPFIVLAAIIVLGGLFTEAGFVLFNIGNVSIKQAITPDELQGRVTSILVVVTRASIPIGGLLGGALGEWVGLRETLFIGGIGMISSALWLVYFRVWQQR